MFSAPLYESDILKKIQQQPPRRSVTGAHNLQRLKVFSWVKKKAIFNEKGNNDRVNGRVHSRNTRDKKENSVWTLV